MKERVQEVLKKFAPRSKRSGDVELVDVTEDG